MCTFIFLSKKTKHKKGESFLDHTISTFINRFKGKIQNFLGKENFLIRFAGYLTKFIKRSRKIRPETLISTLIIASFRSKASTLLDMVSIYKSLDPEIQLAQVSIGERINSTECKNFVKMTLGVVLQTKILDFVHNRGELLDPFNRVLLEDSSKCELVEELKGSFKGGGGNASQSSVKINTIYDLKNARFIHFQEYSGIESDIKIGGHSLEVIEKGDLIIRDLGYLKILNLVKVIAKGAFFLSRLSGKINIYETKDGEKIPFETLFKKYNIDGKLDIYVFIGEEKFYTRLVAYKVPEEIANKRRRNLNKTAKHHGRKTLQENNNRQGYTIFITNVSGLIWPTEIIQTLYRLRWQIELVFRSWKSQLKIHILQGTNENRIRTLLYARWLAIVICTYIFELITWYSKRYLGEESSFHKLINWFLIGSRFEEIIIGDLSVIRKLLNELGGGWNKQKKRISSLSMVENKEVSYV